MIRRAAADDADAIADVFTPSFRGLPFLPSLHTGEEDRAWIRSIVLPRREVAKRRRPEGFRLWVFQKNEGARRFYERHGFRLVELTDGSRNEEREPDALYEWTP